MTKNCPAWDAKFIDVAPDFLDKLIVAAVYLDMPVMVDLAAAKWFTLHMNLETAEEVQKKYNTVEETPEMKKKINETFPILK